jgi:IgGFc binding protein
VFDPPIAGAPTTLGAGLIAEFVSDTPFVVRSQNKDHPFLAFSYMGGSETIASQGGPVGYGDAEFVRNVPGLQYLRRYVFFTDPTYPETNLVVVRRVGAAGFADVTLDCAGTLSGWQPLGGGGQYQWTRADLSKHAFEPQGACNTGRREMSSTQSFGLTVWGWGTPETRPGEAVPCALGEPNNSCDVSYGYPAGENVIPINDVVIF